MSPLGEMGLRNHISLFDLDHVYVEIRGSIGRRRRSRTRGSLRPDDPGRWFTESEKRGKSCNSRAMLCASGSSMHKHGFNEMMTIPAQMRWSGSRVRRGPGAHAFVRGVIRSICPRRHLRVLPTRTRPSLFGGD